MEETQENERLIEALKDIETLTRPDEHEAKGVKINRDELLNDIGKLARMALDEAGVDYAK